MRTSRDQSFSLTRRAFVIGAAAVALPLVNSSRANAANDAAPMSADAALAMLKEGNAAFVTKVTQTRSQTIEERAALGAGQAPFASVLTCADSRTTPEIIFNQGLGDIFVVRVAGNVATATEAGSLEYASAVLKSQLIVVMGHSSCGAVKAAIDLTKGSTFPGHIQTLAKIIEPAAVKTKGQAGDWTVNANKENVQLSIRTLQESAVLSDLIKAGQLKIVGAYYQLETGKVTFL
jgi:carbonic anhydrase